MEETVWREDEVHGGRTRFFVRSLEPAASASDGDELVLLLHGWPEDGSSWSHVAPALAAAGHRVAAPDLKGFGRSDSPRRGYDPETLADEISQLIRGLGARKALVVGHDWGGAVALATAFRHPGHVRGLVTVSSPFRKLDLRAAWHVPLLNVPVTPELVFRLGSGPLVRAVIRYAAVVQEPFTDEVLARYARAVSTTGWLGYYRTLSRRAVVDGGMRWLRRRVSVLSDPARPHHLRVPAVVVWGTKDRATPFHLARSVADDLGASLVAIDGVGHFVHEEAPQRLVEVVLEMAAGTGGSAHTTSGSAG